MGTPPSAPSSSSLPLLLRSLLPPVSLWLPLMMLLLPPLAGRAGAQPALVPWPQQIEWLAGGFPLRDVAVATEPGLGGWAAPLREHLRDLGALAPDAHAGTRAVHVQRDTLLPDEGYTLVVEEPCVTLSARSAAGALHALRTLQQLETRGDDGRLRWPAARIQDAPAFAWRGAMLDVSRHFYSVESLQRFLDELAFLKMNVFHWHLTDDQGWRVEVKRHPELAEVGAWRIDADGTRYGGFYTQDDVRRIVQYAAERGITVVPEIEFPGHCTAALAACPRLGCRQAALSVPSHWGVFQDVYCVGREATWTYVLDVFDELLPLFPAAWFHIGGDEVPQDRWRACADCRERRQAESLSSEDALQAWAIRRVQAWLSARGKQLIGWDEILDGGLGGTAIVEVWRGDELARRARANGNRMIRTLYFNTSPASLKLAEVMRYDPRVDGSDALILGAECPVWSEHIDERSLGYMVFPRLQAFAERLWTGGEPREDLRRRIAPHVERLEREDWITAQADRDLFAVRVRYDPARGDWQVIADAGRPDIAVRFATEERAGVFAESLRVDSPGRVRLVPTWRGGDLQDAREFRIVGHLGLGAGEKLSDPPDPKYGLDPAGGLSDGLLGTDDFHDGLWQGWQGRDLEITLDLGRPLAIEELSIRCLQAVTSWILLPRSVEFRSSPDGASWNPIRTVTHAVPVEPGGQLVHAFAVTLPQAITARYVQARLGNQGRMPAWHLGAGGDSWIFADEFIVR